MTGFRFTHGLALLILAAATASGAEQVFQWKVSEGGNDHYYTAVAGDTWHEAEAAAIAIGGHLVAINSGAEEN